MNERDTLERELRAALHGMADDHVPPPLPRDLWERGRTPRRRAWDTLTVAAAVVLVALLASVVVLQRPDLLLRPAEAPGDGALPTEVWVPGPMDGVDPPDLGAVGRASFAGLLSDDTVLLVDAVDGEHQMRTLPDLSPLEASGSALALSPDGTQLAWVYTRTEGSRSSTVAGVAVAHLVDGGWTSTPLRSDADLPVRVDALQWSFDGGSLAWSGSEFEPDEGDTSRNPLVGVIDVTGGTDRVWELPRKWSANVIGATDDGGLVVSDQTTLWQLSGDEPEGVLDPASGTRLPEAVDNSDQWSAPISPDGSTFVTTAWVEGRDQEALTAEIRLDDPTAQPLLRSWSWGAEALGWGVTSGWTHGGALLYAPATENFPILRSDEQLDSSSVLTQVHTDGEMPAFSIATALGDADPVDFAPPPWAPGRSPWLVVGLLCAAALVGAWLLRRRLRPTRRSRAELVRWVAAVAITAAGVGLVLSGALRDVPVPWVLGGAVLVGLAASLRERVSPVRGGLLRVVVLGVVLGVATAPLWPHSNPTSDDAVLPAVAHVPRSYGYEAYPDMLPNALDGQPGTTSVVLLSEFETVTLVDAHDGTHRVVTLPGLQPDGRDRTPAPALDPTGTRIAWASTGDPVDDSGTFDEDAWSGLAILDLTTGEVEELPLTGRRGKPVQVFRLAWSPDGSHVAWFGDEAARWNENGDAWAGKARAAGVTRLADLQSPSWPLEDLPSPWSVGIAVGDDGVARLLSGRRMWTYDIAQADRDLEVRRVSDRARRWSSAVVSPDGTTLLAGVNGGQEIQGNVSGLRTLDLTDPEARFTLHPWTGAEPGDQVDVLGHDPNGLPVVVHDTSDFSAERDTDATVRVLDGPDARGLTRIQGDTYGDVRLSVATGLADRAPVEFAEPRAPIGDGRKALLAIVAVALVAQLVQLARAPWTRRRRRAA